MASIRWSMECVRLYRRHLANTLLLRNGCIHAEVLEDVQRFRDNGYSAGKAAKLAIGKNKHILKTMMTPDSESETDDESESGESGDSDSSNDH